MKATPQAPFELVVVSGKGGTGKTTVSASFAALAGNAVIADCDVDAGNMELLLSPTLRTREDFTGGKQAVIDASLCTGCGRCARMCRFGAIHPVTEAGRRKFAIEPSECEGCAVCVAVCPRKAVSLHTVGPCGVIRRSRERPFPTHMKATPQNPFELVIVSGKGGTGKTTVSASFAALAGNAVIADCDVDAGNMELLLNPTLRTREDFTGGKQAVIDAALCMGCGRCARLCRFGAIHPVTETGRRRFAIEPSECEGCGVCVEVCPRDAVSMHPVVGGELYLSDTAYGPLVHARLKPGLGNSGKLATLVRSRARQTASESGRSLIIIDGPPGVGCPTIASLTGATQVLAVTEPTLSGEHDLARILELCRQFKLPVQVCVNKADINPEATERIRKSTEEEGAIFAGEIPYDEAISEATRQGRPIVSTQPQSPPAKAITSIWAGLSGMI